MQVRLAWEQHSSKKDSQSPLLLDHSTQQNNATRKWKKECLAIVFACERFDQYLYERDLIRVDSDHKPLLSAPKRLQRMLLRLQKYHLQVHYKKGLEMYIADFLSRAALPLEKGHRIHQTFRYSAWKKNRNLPKSLQTPMPRNTSELPKSVSSSYNNKQRQMKRCSH